MHLGNDVLFKSISIERGRGQVQAQHHERNSLHNVLYPALGIGLSRFSRACLCGHLQLPLSTRAHSTSAPEKVTGGDASANMTAYRDVFEHI